MTITRERDTSTSYGTDPGDPTQALFLGGVGERLSPGAVTEFVVSALGAADLDGKRVCLVVPDGTRTCPLPLLLQAAHQAIKSGLYHCPLLTRRLTAFRRLT